MDCSCKSLQFYATFFFRLCFCFWVCIPAHCKTSDSVSETEFLLSIEADNYHQNIERDNIWEMAEVTRGRRLLGGPGSWPPRCTSKCGGCQPCQPVHVAVPPGTPVTAEYYPEAWRCKCGNKLYMP